MSDVSARSDDGVKIAITGDVLSAREHLEKVLLERSNTSDTRFTSIEDRVTLLASQLAEEIRAGIIAAQTANDTLERFIVAKSEAIKDQTELSFTMNNIAISKAEAATEKRFEAVNAFREQLGEQAARFASRESMDLQTSTLRDYGTALNTRLTVTEAKAAAAQQTAEEARTKSKDYFALLLASASLILAVVNMIRIH